MPKKDLIPVIYEDEFILAVNKPAGVPSVPDPRTPLPKSVLGMVQKKYEGKGVTPYLLHRLDAQTSGALLFGKAKKKREVLEGILRDPGTKKKYIALVRGLPKGDKITFHLKARESNELIPAETRFKVLRVFDLFDRPFTFVEAEIKSGRRHQIRQHFAKIGCPVVMDSLYGDDRLNRKFRIEFHFSRLFLHARSIHFNHPFLKIPITIEAPFPPDISSFLKKIFGKDRLF